MQFDQSEGVHVHPLANLGAMLEFLLLCLIVQSSEQGRQAKSQPGICKFPAIYRLLPRIYMSGLSPCADAHLTAVHSQQLLANALAMVVAK